MGSKIWGWIYQQHRRKQIQREEREICVMKDSGVYHPSLVLPEVQRRGEGTLLVEVQLWVSYALQGGIGEYRRYQNSQAFNNNKYI
jgi:hypothetical protein